MARRNTGRQGIKKETKVKKEKKKKEGKQMKKERLHHCYSIHDRENGRSHIKRYFFVKKT